MTPKKKVYLFYSIIIAIIFTLLLAFHLSLFFRASLCTLIFFCCAVMRSVHKASSVSSGYDHEDSSSESNEELNDIGKTRRTSAVDACLRLLKERDKSMADTGKEDSESEKEDHSDN